MMNVLINNRIFRRRLSFVSAVFIFAIVLVILGSSVASAKGSSDVDNDREKCYKSITIEKGDSLWSIAEEYLSEEYDSVEEYIDELMIMNNLKNSTINAGNSLLVTYYTDAR